MLLFLALLIHRSLGHWFEALSLIQRRVANSSGVGELGLSLGGVAAVFDEDAVYEVGDGLIRVRTGGSHTASWLGPSVNGRGPWLRIQDGVAHVQALGSILSPSELPCHVHIVHGLSIKNMRNSFARVLFLHQHHLLRLRKLNFRVGIHFNSFPTFEDHWQTQTFVSFSKFELFFNFDLLSGLLIDQVDVAPRHGLHCLVNFYFFLIMRTLTIVSDAGKVNTRKHIEPLVITVSSNRVHGPFNS